MPRSSGKKTSASTPKITATIDWPAILAQLRRPSERCSLILMKSSRKPTMPSPTVRNSTSTPDAVGAVRVSRCEPTYAITTAVMITRPPMVGVPRLVWWVVGPSSRMSWP